ncbi:hypothetical protein PoB_000630200 [Plakobranchus ocellatus]|uniref:Uncharacterized protein n=1 Tax=Plakobranchus ocellatus TaxID=259542 RepID=A0AAV3YBI4_9GAST|nr:hypothetical protein PoB_000630200 [Plakobranchus ocellatus]
MVRLLTKKGKRAPVHKIDLNNFIDIGPLCPITSWVCEATHFRQNSLSSFPQIEHKFLPSCRKNSLKNVREIQVALENLYFVRMKASYKASTLRRNTTVGAISKLANPHNLTTMAKPFTPMIADDL